MEKKQHVRRLNKELKDLIKEPVPHIVAFPSQSNILEWHYVITGPDDTPYRGGFYHGKLKFPPQYPLKPPGIMMLTPNGRFKTNQRLCLSMSDFHPESWNPLWSVGSILTGLLSFMLEDKATTGSIVTNDAQKRQYALESMDFNMKDPAFRKLFPDIIEKWKSGQQQLGASASPSKDSATGEKEKGAVSGEGGKAAGEEEKPKAEDEAKKPEEPQKLTKNQRRKEQRKKKKESLQAKEKEAPPEEAAAVEPKEPKAELSSLSVRELRALLEKHKIDATGAIEKEDLVELARKNNL